MFRLNQIFAPCGDQPKAIEKLSKGIKEGKRAQVLLGITGSGKTFTMANVIAKSNKPTLVLAHNKTLAAQLYQEFKEFFPSNAVEYFVSYYDYYQPEAYIARTDTYIEKDLAINDRIERMRLSATRSLVERRDVIIISSVSCIYGLGEKENFEKMRLCLSVGMKIDRDRLALDLIHIQYKRSEDVLDRSTFRVRGDRVEMSYAYEEELALRIDFFGDEIEKLSHIDPLSGALIEKLDKVFIYPGSHYVMPEEVREEGVSRIQEELQERRDYFLQQERFAEEERIRERTKHDLELIREMGFCKGIENYSRHFSCRRQGEPPACLLDYFPEDFLIFVDESHQTIPQIRAMYHGDRARKVPLVEYGFRLPSAFDNRPLTFDEFYQKISQVIYVSATPALFELEDAGGEVVEQIIRPTGLLDPVCVVKEAENQVDDAMEEIRKEKEKGGRVLVTTLTKKLAETLSDYLNEIGVLAKYLHSDIDTLERIHIIQELREGLFDVLVGINLLREGLDIPEVSLVLILDADKEGFLRSETSLIQTCGRAARNVEGRVILYAHKKTRAIEKTLQETERRRALQQEYNFQHKITPKSALRRKNERLESTFFGTPSKQLPLNQQELEKKIAFLEEEMKKSAKAYDFKTAARLRDEWLSLKKMLL